ncbi:MAG TPA: RNA methyltransferase, partial [Clostridium sp.]|nr:RNA methyltransferase [Clostridium sp.]
LVDNAIIAVGNEGNGISDEVMNLATFKVKIPMLGNTESLNVAIAASIMIYEGVRQKLNKKY